MADISAFKHLYMDIFKNSGETTIAKKPIKCYVKESYPHFLVTDSYFYVAAYFTKKAVDEFHQKFTNLNITDLRSRVIIITDWALEMNKVNSANVFTSYGGLEVKLIVKSFKPVPQDKEQPSLERHPVNLFRDDEMKTIIQNYTHKCMSKAVSSAKENMQDITKMSNKGNISQGVVSFASGANFSSYNFKEGKTASVDMTALVKQEKGADYLKKHQAQQAGSSKAKVTGGPKGKRDSKAAGKKVSNIAEKINRATPGGKSASAHKKSTTRILSRAPTMQSPGGEKQVGTTDHSTMKDFHKMISFLKKTKGPKVAGKRAGSVSKISKNKK